MAQRKAVSVTFVGLPNERVLAGPCRHDVYPACIVITFDDLFSVHRGCDVVDVLTAGAGRPSNAAYYNLDAFPVVYVIAVFIGRVVDVIEKRQRLAAAFHLLDEGGVKCWPYAPAIIAAWSSRGRVDVLRDVEPV